MAAFGGTAPLVANFLQNRFDNQIAPVFYVLLTAGIALIVLGKENDLISKMKIATT